MFLINGKVTSYRFKVTWLTVAGAFIAECLQYAGRSVFEPRKNCLLPIVYCLLALFRARMVKPSHTKPSIKNTMSASTELRMPPK